MKRRSFLKSLFAAALAPIAALKILVRTARGKPGNFIQVTPPRTLDVRQDGAYYYLSKDGLWKYEKEDFQPALDQMRLANRRKLKHLFTN